MDRVQNFFSSNFKCDKLVNYVGVKWSEIFLINSYKSLVQICTVESLKNVLTSQLWSIFNALESGSFGQFGEKIVKEI